MNFAMILFIVSFLMLFSVLSIYMTKHEANVIFALTKAFTVYVLGLGILVNVLGFFYLYTLQIVAIFQLIVAIGLYVVYLKINRRVLERQRIVLDKYEAIFFLGVVLFVVIFYAKYGIYYLYADRDPFFYTTSAIRMSELKTFFVELSDFEKSLRSQISLVSKDVLMTDTTFLPYITGLLAVGYDLGERVGLTVVNPILAGVALVWMYYFVEKVFNKRVAMVSVILLMVNPAMIWNARVPQSEIVCMVIIFCASYYFFEGLKKDKSNSLYIGAVVLSIIHLVRIDMYFCGLAMSATLIGLLILDKEKAAHFWKPYITYMVISIMFLVFSIMESYKYVVGHWEKGVLMYLASANYIIMCVCFILRMILKRVDLRDKISNWIYNLLNNQYVIGGWITFCVLFTIYWRYLYEQFYNYPKWYMVYTSVVVFIMLLVGIWLYFREKSENWIDNLFFCALGVGMLVVYLYRPNIAIDNMWMSRRWITACIPFTIVIAVYALDKMVKKDWIQRMVVVLLAIFYLYSSRGFLFKDFYIAIDTEYQKVAELLEDDKIYFSTTSKYIHYPLRYYCLKSVFSLDVNSDIVRGVKKYIDNNDELVFIGSEQEFYTLITKIGEEYIGEKIYEGVVRTSGLERMMETLPMEEIEHVFEVNIYSIKKTGEIYE